MDDLDPEDRHALLAAHRPILRYDSFEPYFATRVEALLCLGEAGEEVAGSRCRMHLNGADEADPREALALLSGVRGADGALAYDGGPGCLPTDRLRIAPVPPAAQDYRRDGAIQQERHRHAVYGRAVRVPAGWWLQYWLFSFGDDRFDPDSDPEHGGFVQHEADWEMVQIRVPAQGDPPRPAATPDRVTYSQHQSAARRHWRTTKRERGRLVAYPARGTHANYARTTSWIFDRTDGAYEVEPDLVVLEDDTPWARWPGVWGADPGSPEGLAGRRAWRDPQGYDDDAEPFVWVLVKGFLTGLPRKAWPWLKAAGGRVLRLGVRRAAPPATAAAVPRAPAAAPAGGAPLRHERAGGGRRPWQPRRGTVTPVAGAEPGRVVLEVAIPGPGSALSIRYVAARVVSPGRYPRVCTWKVDPGLPSGFAYRGEIPWTLAPDEAHRIEVRGASLWGIDEFAVDAITLAPRG